MDLRQLIITPDLLKLIVEVDEFKAMWEGDAIAVT
jgi:hypothetical protein